MSQELEADRTGKSYQLYSGSPAFTKVKPTDGREDEKRDPLADDEDD